MDRSKRYLERKLSGHGDEGGGLEGIEGASQVSSYPSGWMALPSAERRHWKKTGFWGEVMGLVWNYVEFEGSLRFQRRDKF